MSKVNLETVTATLSWYKILLLNGPSLISAKLRLLRKQKRAYKSFSSRHRRQKAIFSDNSLELLKSCEDLSWTPRRSETKGIAERAVRRIKEGTSAVLLPSGLDENGGLLLWFAVGLCEMSKTSWEMGQHLMNGDPANHSNDHPISAKDQSRLHLLGKKVLPGIFLGCASIAGGIWKGDTLVTDMEELENMNASEIHPQRINAKEVLTPQKGEDFTFPRADGPAKLSGEIANSKNPLQGGNRP